MRETTTARLRSMKRPAATTATRRACMFCWLPVPNLKRSDRGQRLLAAACRGALGKRLDGCRPPGSGSQSRRADLLRLDSSPQRRRAHPRPRGRATTTDGLPLSVLPRTAARRSSQVLRDAGADVAGRCSMHYWRRGATCLGTMPRIARVGRLGRVSAAAGSVGSVTACRDRGDRDKEAPLALRDPGCHQREADTCTVPVLRCAPKGA